MFSSVHIKNFRAITDLKVENLGRVNLFVGRNACGKTTLLESVFLLLGATNPRLPLSVNAFRGFPYVSSALWATYFHNMDPLIPIEISASESEVGEQALRILPRYQYPQANGGLSKSHDSFDPMLLDSGVGPEVNGLRLEYMDTANRDSKTVSEILVRDKEVETRPGTDGRPHPLRGSFVMAMPSDMRDRFSEVQRKKRLPEVISLLRTIEPMLADLRIGEPQGSLYADTGSAELIPVNLMGGGMVKLLSTALTMLCLRDGFVLIDEIEDGLDYASMGKLWNAVFDWAKKLNVQVFASTHSRECIKAFSDQTEATLFGCEAKLFRLERKDERFRAVEYTRELLAESLDSEWEVR